MKKNKDYTSEYWLYDQYVNKKKNTIQVGKMCGVSHVTILHWMKKFNITRREGFVKGNQINAKTHNSFATEFKEGKNPQFRE